MNSNLTNVFFSSNNLNDLFKTKQKKKCNFTGDESVYVKADNYQSILLYMVKLFRHIDVNHDKQEEKSEPRPSGVLRSVQESVATFAECLLVHDLVESTTCTPISDALSRIVLRAFGEHLAQSTSDELRSRLLTCLVFVLRRRRRRQQQQHRAREYGIEDMRPVLTGIDYLGIVSALSHRQCLTQRFALDSLNMFYALIREVIHGLMSAGRMDKLRAFKESALQWSSNKMTNEMLIDSISTSIASGSSFSLNDEISQHPIMALDKLIDELVRLSNRFEFYFKF